MKAYIHVQFISSSHAEAPLFHEFLTTPMFALFQSFPWFVDAFAVCFRILPLNLKRIEYKNNSFSFFWGKFFYLFLLKSFLSFSAYLSNFNSGSHPFVLFRFKCRFDLIDSTLEFFLNNNMIDRQYGEVVRNSNICKNLSIKYMKNFLRVQYVVQQAHSISWRDQKLWTFTLKWTLNF